MYNVPAVLGPRVTEDVAFGSVALEEKKTASPGVAAQAVLNSPVCNDTATTAIAIPIFRMLFITSSHLCLLLDVGSLEK
jgi:hypothetical protein